MRNYSVAIDGPSGAGKSSISKRLAKELGITHIDTGAIYRTIGYYIYKNDISLDNADEIVNSLDKINIKIELKDNTQQMYCNNEDVTEKIREHIISKYASAVSAIPKVREHLLDLQRDFASKQSIVMDGRDIGTVVLPDADIKIFLTASVQSRAQRRYLELVQKGENIKLEQVLEDVTQRDFNDTNRAVAPLKPAKDSILVDTTNMGFEESVAYIKKIVKERIR